jgi:Icc-related predicted phosphoesterase
MRLVIISDTHGSHRNIKLPAGDILIHAGDFTRHGSDDDVAEFDDWLATLPYQDKIIIAGNHDFPFETKDGTKLLSNGIYLQDSAVTINGIKFYGSPWQPRFFDWAFNLDRGESLKEKWDLIPADTDVLITHGPPYGYLDINSRGFSVGCEELMEAVERTKPRLHVFGHIHEGYGIVETPATTFINACICNLGYRPINMPVIFDI